MIAFWLLGIVLIASAVMTVTQKSPVYSVVGLLANFLALAALFVTLDAEFLAIIQVVVYGGAILMLFVFVIALLSSGTGPLGEGPNRLPFARIPALALVGLAFAALVFAALREPLSPGTIVPPSSTIGPVGSADVFGSIGDFGTALFTTYLLPFEVTAFILMVAVIGVVLIASDAVPQRTRGRHPAGPRPKRKREPIVKVR
jgi:NADH-quinone oxidoreductase subunit J